MRISCICSVFFFSTFLFACGGEAVLDDSTTDPSSAADSEVEPEPEPEPEVPVPDYLGDPQDDASHHSHEP